MNSVPAQRGLVSVIVPTYNRRDTLPRALESIAAQTWRPIEAVVVNDAGEPVEDIVASFRPRMEVLHQRHETNRGLAATRNSALALARGEWIAYLDDDDLLYPEHVATLVSAMTTQAAKIAYADALRVEVEPDGSGGWRELRRIPCSTPFDPDRLRLNNYLPVQSVMHARCLLEETGAFNAELRHREDADLWFRMSLRHAFLHVPVMTSEYLYRVSGPGLSNETAGQQAATLIGILARHPREAMDSINTVLEQRRLLGVENASLHAHPLLRGWSWLKRLRPGRKG